MSVTACQKYIPCFLDPPCELGVLCHSCVGLNEKHERVYCHLSPQGHSAPKSACTSGKQGYRDCPIHGRKTAGLFCALAMTGDDALPAALDSLKTTMTLDSRDWGADRRDSWLYGIVVGWESASLAELREKHGWTDDDCRRLQAYAKAIRKARR